MKIINHGNQYEIYPDDLRTYDQLPAATYRVSFNPMSGFSLIKIVDFETIESKIYGDHEQKIDKVLNSYERFDRSMGVILSGDKGMGKSLFVQLLAYNAIQRDIPVIMVSEGYGGLTHFIESIDQEVLVIFDEFEKMFSATDDKEGQNSLLGLFDGTSQRKRLYAITVNELHRVSSYMLSRPGRFHYHLTFSYPTADEIRVYLTDKLEPAYYGQIDQVIAFAHRVKLNYDSLRAIAFELNIGSPFAEIITDLNIATREEEYYDILLTFDNNLQIEVRREALKMFAETIEFDGYTKEYDYFETSFKPSDILSVGDSMVIDGNNANVNLGNDAENHSLKDRTLVNIEMRLSSERAKNYVFNV